MLAWLRRLSLDALPGYAVPPRSAFRANGFPVSGAAGGLPSGACQEHGLAVAPGRFVPMADAPQASVPRAIVLQMIVLQTSDSAGGPCLDDLRTSAARVSGFLKDVFRMGDPQTGDPRTTVPRTTVPRTSGLRTWYGGGGPCVPVRDCGADWKP
jgi:hypothetical protein